MAITKEHKPDSTETSYSMTECRVEITETLTRIVTVKVPAGSESQAKYVAQDMYRNGDIVLDADDLVETEFINLP